MGKSIIINKYYFKAKLRLGITKITLSLTLDSRQPQVPASLVAILLSFPHHLQVPGDSDVQMVTNFYDHQFWPVPSHTSCLSLKGGQEPISKCDLFLALGFI